MSGVSFTRPFSKPFFHQLQRVCSYPMAAIKSTEKYKVPKNLPLELITDRTFNHYISSLSTLFHHQSSPKPTLPSKWSESPELPSPCHLAACNAPSRRCLLAACSVPSSAARALNECLLGTCRTKPNDVNEPASRYFTSLLHLFMIWGWEHWLEN
jgi:hypothetical protein